MSKNAVSLLGKCLAPFLIALAGLLAYSNSYSGVFLFDDYRAIVDKPGADGCWLLTLGSRFVVDFTFKLNYLIGGLKVADYHAVNILIHILCGLLLFGIIRRTLILPYFSGRFTERSAAILGGAIASVWLVHPIQTESVTYICQRYELMMGLFFLSGLYSFIRAGRGTAGFNGWYMISVICSVVGMACKEVMVAMPVATLLYDYMFIAPSFNEIIRLRWKYYSALFAGCFVVAVLFMFDVAGAMANGAAFSMLPRVSPFAYICTQFGVVVHYLKISLFPLSLCLDYGWPKADGIAAILIPAMPVIVLLVATVWAVFKKWPIGFIGAWFFITLAPSSSIFPVADYAFEHRMYLPLASLASAVVTGIYLLFDGVLLRKNTGAAETSTAVVSLILVVLLGCLTFQRNYAYLSEEVMWRDVVDKRPENLRAKNDLATVYAQQGRIQDAVGLYNEVLSSIPAGIRRRIEAGKMVVMGSFANNSYEYNYFWAHANMGLLVFKEAGDADAAVAHYISALRVAPNCLTVREKLKVVLRCKKVSEKDLDVEIARLLHSTDVRKVN